MMNFKNALRKYELSLISNIQPFFLFFFLLLVEIFYGTISYILLKYQVKNFFLKKKNKVNGILSYLLLGAIISISVIVKIKYNDLGFVEYYTKDIGTSYNAIKPPIVTLNSFLNDNAVSNIPRIEKQFLSVETATTDNTARYEKYLKTFFNSPIPTTRYNYGNQAGYALNADSSFSICSTKKRLMYDVSRADYIEL